MIRLLLRIQREVARRREQFMARSIVKVIRAECVFCKTMTSAPTHWRRLKECQTTFKDRTHVGFCPNCSERFSVEEDKPLPSTMY